MIEPPAVQWDGSLESLFIVLDGACRTGVLPRRLDRAASFAETVPLAGTDRRLQPELFAAPEAQAAAQVPARTEDPGGPPWSVPEGFPPLFPELRRRFSAVLLREISADAFDAVIHAWMSEFPIAAEIIRFAGRVIAAARAAVSRTGPTETTRPYGSGVLAEPAGPLPPGAAAAQSPGWAAQPEARRGAAAAALNRDDPETRVVLEAAYKASREIDRIRGLLRFSPWFPGGGPGSAASSGENPGVASSSGGPVYVARCVPDHHVLPGLADHFTRRFGGCPWAVVDKKRCLVLAGGGGRDTWLFPLGGARSPDPRCPAPDYDSPSDYYEDLWRNYYCSINNPARNKPGLRRQFMPRRYWKYLPELQ